MENWQPSTLSWSNSRKTHFDDCKRHYFYHRFWGQDPRTRWRIYEMRCITTIKMTQGRVVHEVIAETLASARDGSPVSLEIAKRAVTNKMWERYRESDERLWEAGNRPPGRKISTITNLLEHYYGFPDALDRARAARNTGWLCLENLFASDLWQQIVTGNFDKWKELEEDGFPSFDLDGIKVYAGIDFAFEDETPTIIDWKTGTSVTQDRTQLTVYSLYGQSRWGWKPDEIRLMAVYLQPNLVVEEFSPTAEDVERTDELVKRSFAEMLELEPAYGPADINRFPIRETPDHCRWCRFQGVCEGAQRLKSDVPAEEPDWEE